MTTKFVTGITNQEDSFEAGKMVAQEASQKMGSSPLHLVVLFCATRYEYAAVMRGIRSIVGEDVPLIGCTTAGQFTSEGVSRGGVTCALISSDTHLFFPGIGTQLKADTIQAIENASRTFPKDVEGFPHQSAILLIDGLAGKGEEAVVAAVSVLGPLVQFAGGTAADDLNFKETYVFNNGEAFTDAVSLCLITSRLPIVISVKHGHHPLSPPLRITKARDNVLYELDGKPALQVWKDFLRGPLKEEGIDIDAISLSDLSSKVFLKYEAGLMAGEDDYKIRFPASCNPDGSFNFVCSMMEGSVIKIMTSEQEDQIESARQAVKMALQASQGVELAGALIFDCVCHSMILQENFPKVVEAKQELFGELPFMGCETYGEIAMEMGEFSGFHNTTTVIMLFPS